MGSFPGRKLAGCFSPNKIAIGPCENTFPGPALALDGPGGNLFVPFTYVQKSIMNADAI